MSHHRWYARSAAILLAPLALAACSEGSLTEPAGPSFSHGGTHYVTVCKQGPEGSTATFSVTASGGTVLPAVVGGEVTIAASPVSPTASCVEVWASTDGTPVEVTVSEVDMTPGTQIENIVVFGGGTPVIDIPNGTVTVNGDSGALIQFKNGGIPVVEGFEGCTPGFWRQEHHYQYWTGYTPGGAWTTAFASLGGTHTEPGKNGATFSDSTTLGSAVLFGGGGIFALARHAVAAILNASSADTDYPLTVAEVQALVNGAIASGNYEAAKNTLAGYNELGCDIKESR